MLFRSRLLAVEGATFKELIEQSREAGARRLLRDTDLTVNDIARLLDYTKGGPF